MTALRPFSTRVALEIARRYAVRNMNARVRVSRMAAPTPSAGGSSEATVEETVYEGAGHLSVLSGPMTMGLGDVPQFFATTTLSIPVETALGRIDPMVNDMVLVVSQDDPMAVGRVFRVMHVAAAGLLPVVHSLQLTGWEASNYPADSSFPPEWLVGS